MTMTAEKISPTELNRIVKLIMDSGEAESIEAAERLLSTYAVRVAVGDDGLDSRAAQAALLTIIVAGRRALPGGVFVEGNVNVPLAVPLAPYTTLGEAAKALGGRLGAVAPRGLPLVAIGRGVARRDDAPVAVRCVMGGWRGGVIPLGAAEEIAPGADLSLAGVLAGAFAVSEIFQHLRGGFAQAGRRIAGLSLWEPDRLFDWLIPSSSEPMVEFLPSEMWLVGLGHLGQAYLWTLGLLPYADKKNARIILQDYDTLDLANESTSVLTSRTMRGELKTRAMARWSEQQGFRTSLIERAFGDNLRVQEGEPVLALSGVDNPNARAALESAGFSWIIDAGLGAGVSEFLAMRLYTFPGPRLAREVWAKKERARALPIDKPAYQALKEAGVDECGLTLLAERTVGAPFVGVTAATLVIGEILRGLHAGRPVLALDATLRSFEDRLIVMGEAGSRPNPGFCPAKFVS